MPRRKTQLVNGEFYHIIKRGIEDRNIYIDDDDYFRFVNSLLVFNDQTPAPWQSRAFWNQRDPASLCQDYRPKDPLVEIHVFTLMPNHFHLLVRQLTERGIVVFMNKLGGYSYYFNKKYSRQGTLFQNRYKIIHIENEEQLKNNFVYIHTNPLSLIETKWKEWKVKDPQRATRFLEDEYRWSSYQSYLNKNNFAFVKQDFFLNLLGGKEGIKKEINSWILFKAATTTRPGLVELE